MVGGFTMEISSVEFKQFLHGVIDMVEEQKDYFCELDRKIGDGDHGVTMSIGWQAVKEKLNEELQDETDIAKLSITAGKTFLSAVGSSVGPLYATGFMRGAKVAKGKDVLTGEEWKDYWVAFANGIQERGQAKVGDKTMVDTLAPFAKKLEEAYAESNDFYEAFEEALVAGEVGMKSTIDIVSKLGRSSRLGERSLGAQDPGATSIYYILNTFFETMKQANV